MPQRLPEGTYPFFPAHRSDHILAAPAVLDVAGDLPGWTVEEVPKPSRLDQGDAIPRGLLACPSLLQAGVVLHEREAVQGVGKLAVSLGRVEIVGTEAGVAQALADGSALNGEHQQPTRHHCTLEEREELLPRGQVKMGKERAHPDQVERLAELYFSRMLMPVDRLRSETLCTEVNGAMVDVADSDSRVRVFRPQSPNEDARLQPTAVSSID